MKSQLFLFFLLIMAGNTFGKIIQLTTYGESHGEVIGGVIDGIPSERKIDLKLIDKDLQRRRPGQSHIVTQRKEDDEVKFLSGLVAGKTTGMPIGFIIRNMDQRSKDYSHIKNLHRPSHADRVYEKKYGIRDYRGGGRSSARETVARVVAGSLCKQIIYPITITSYVSSVGPIVLKKNYKELDFTNIDKNIVRCPDMDLAIEMQNYIESIKKSGDTTGGIVSCVIQNVPIGLGEPVFDKLHADLGKAMLSINSVKGFQYGSGFNGTKMKGSLHNDLYLKSGKTKTNYSGGIQGGISNGMDIYFDVAFKPISTIMKRQKSFNLQGKEVVIDGRGRHDSCVVPRAVPIVEAMAALVIADHLERNKN